MKVLMGICFILIAFHFNANSAINKTNPKNDFNRVSKSCIEIETERERKQRLRKGTEKQDLFVQMNSFSSYMSGFEHKMEQMSESTDGFLYSFASAGILSVEFETVFTPMILAYCNEEDAVKNKCNYKIDNFDGSKIIVETQWKSATKYTMTQSVQQTENSPKKVAAIISSELPNYWNGSMTLFDKDGSKSIANWSRDSNGTEHYHSEANGSDGISSTTFTEYPNCSANIVTIKKGIKITAEWSINENKSTGKFNYCNKNDCDNGSW